MGTAPRFSFLTTAYRTEPYVRDTIDSLVAQTCADWELVIVDNGNSDAMADIVRSYSHDPRIKLVRHENRGYVGGVTSAAAHATGDYLCVLDSDDQLMPRFCAEVGALLDSDRGIDAVGVDAARFTDDGPDHLVGYLRSIGVRRRPDPGVPLTMVDVLGGLVPYYTAAVRRESWDAMGGFASGVPGIDDSVVFWLRMVRKYDVRVLPRRLARYRLRSDSLSRDPAGVEKFEAELERSFLTAEPSSAAEVAALHSTLRRIRYWKLLRQARTALLAGDDRAARRAATAAFGQKPTARSAAVVTAVTLAPGLLRLIHPVKQRAESAIEDVVIKAS
jgi:glycosyltransferase involved in cell wall biosynthesis